MIISTSSVQNAMKVSVPKVHMFDSRLLTPRKVLSKKFRQVVRSSPPNDSTKEYVMANPQAENGHTQINHETFEKLIATDLNGTQWAIIATVIRKTWGYRKKADFISLNQFSKATGRHRSGIITQLRILQKRRILTKLSPGKLDNTPAQWAINKDWEQWDSPLVEGPREISPKSTNLVEKTRPGNGSQPSLENVSNLVENSLKPSRELCPNKRNIQKKTTKDITASRKSRASPLSENFQLSARTRAWAEDKYPQANIDDQFSRFQNFHIGKGTLWVNWDRAFMTWMGNYRTFNPPKPIRRKEVENELN